MDQPFNGESGRRMLGSIVDGPSRQDASDSGKILSCRCCEQQKIKDQLMSETPSDLKFVPIISMGRISKTTRAKNDLNRSFVGTMSGSIADGPSGSGKNWSRRSHQRQKIKDQLLSEIPSDLKVISIVGMGGIGKTTLAKSAYEDSEISNHFHLRSWITISQNYVMKNVLLGLLRSLVGVDGQLSQWENEELDQELYKNLKGKRFLIVLDDVWKGEIWNEFKRIFPNDNNGSRVILTTRLIEVADYIEPNSPPHLINCLLIEESWRLLRTEVFGGKPCPSELVDVGREIARKCQGLPLAIVVVAGHLSKIDKNRDCWIDFVERLDSVVTSSKNDEDNILDILSLSYNHLPLHLKACFLYMGIFPKSSRIHVKKLVRLWCVVGFLESEDKSRKSLEDLMNRNLIMVAIKKYGRSKRLVIHDLLVDLIFREARKEGHFIFSQFNFRHSGFNSSSTSDDMNHLIDLTSSYLYCGKTFETSFPLTSVFFRLLKVLDIQSQSFEVLPEIITDLVNLRYLDLKAAQISGSVSKLCKLETLINRYKRRVIHLPEEIWLLSNLRHLVVEKATFEIPIPCNNKLERLSTVSFGSCKELAFSRIPNIKQLKICDIYGEDENLSSFINNLVDLHQLEKLNLHFRDIRFRKPQKFAQCYSFPLHIKQLILSGSRLEWECMNILANLANLEVLKLKTNAFIGTIYEQTAEGFPRLKVLLIESEDLEQWIAETYHYPVLQHLVLIKCYRLENVPPCFGELQTLESIRFDFGTYSAWKSIESIKREQQDLGNDIEVYRTYLQLNRSMKI